MTALPAYFGNLDGFSGGYCNVMNSNFDATFYNDPDACTTSQYVLCYASTTQALSTVSTQYTGLSYTLPVATSTLTSLKTYTYTGPLTVSISGEPVATIPVVLDTFFVTEVTSSVSTVGSVAAQATVTVTSTSVSYLATETSNVNLTVSTTLSESPYYIVVYRTTYTYTTIYETVTIGTTTIPTNTQTFFTTMTFTSTECLSQVTSTLTIPTNTTIFITTTSTTIEPAYIG